MQSGDFLLIYGVVVILLLIFFFRGKRKAPDLRLHLSTHKPVVSNGKDTSEKSIRDLNCFFNFNGETWDAWEVLAVPAGGSHDEIARGFKAAVEKSPSAETFYRAAYEALIDSANQTKK
jgi:hypothetical protein